MVRPTERRRPKVKEGSSSSLARLSEMSPVLSSFLGHAVCTAAGHVTKLDIPTQWVE